MATPPKVPLPPLHCPVWFFLALLSIIISISICRSISCPLLECELCRLEFPYFHNALLFFSLSTTPVPGKHLATGAMSEINQVFLQACVHAVSLP